MMNINDINNDLKNILSHKDNQYCIDCNLESVSWANIYLGIFLCIDCILNHEEIFHNEIVKDNILIKSINIPNLSFDNLLYLKVGGNNNFKTMLRRYNINNVTNNDELSIIDKKQTLKNKYFNKAVNYYKNFLYSSINNLNFKQKMPSIEEGKEIVECYYNVDNSNKSNSSDNSIKFNLQKDTNIENEFNGSTILPKINNNNNNKFVDDVNDFIDNSYMYLVETKNSIKEDIDKADFKGFIKESKEFISESSNVAKENIVKSAKGLFNTIKLKFNKFRINNDNNVNTDSQLNNLNNNNTKENITNIEGINKVNEYNECNNDATNSFFLFSKSNDINANTNTEKLDSDEEMDEKDFPNAN